MTAKRPCHIYEAVESDGNYAEAWAQAGFATKLGHHTEAIETSSRSRGLRPSAESYFNIGLANYCLETVSRIGRCLPSGHQTRSLQRRRRRSVFTWVDLSRQWAKPDEEFSLPASDKTET